MSNIPPEPAERCRCILPVTLRGHDPNTGFGVTFCDTCKRWIKWGVAEHSLTGPKS